MSDKPPLYVWLIGLISRLGIVSAICVLLTNTIGTFIPSGQQLAFAANKVGHTEIYLIDISRFVVANLTANTAYDIMPAWTSDGQSMLFTSNREGDFNLYIHDLRSGETTRLTQHPADELSPSWSPDNRWLAFMSDREGTPLIYRVNSENLRRHDFGDMEVENLTDRRATGFLTSSDLPGWSPDGSQIVYQRRGERMAWELHIMSADGTHTRKLIELIDADTRQPRWSPDGSQVVFQAQKLSGDSDIYIMNVQTRRYRPLTSTPYADESWPVWTPDGQYITYIERGSLYPPEKVMMIEPDSGLRYPIFGYGESMLTLAWRPGIRPD